MTPHEAEFLELALTVELGNCGQFSEGTLQALRSRAETLIINRNPEALAEFIRLNTAMRDAKEAMRTFCKDLPHGLEGALFSKYG